MTSDEIRSINHSYEMALRNLNSRAWAAMSDSEKINLLQAIEDKNAMDQNRIACEVLSEPMPPNDRGYHTDNLIMINSDLLNGHDIFETTKTLYHEGSHAMDMQARYFPEVRSQFTPEQLAARGTPIPNPDVDPEGYWNHPAEVAAREAGERGAEKIMSDREHVLAVDRQMNAEHPTNQILQTFD